MPALFQGEEDSSAGASRRSKTIWDHCGSSVRRNAPRVALIIPAPMSATSTSAAAVALMAESDISISLIFF